METRARRAAWAAVPVTRRLRSAAARLLLSGLFCGLLWAPPVVAAKKDGAALVARLNERWAGARCRIRITVPLKKGRNSDGWTKSFWIVPAEQWKFKAKNSTAIFWVSNRDAFPANRILPGTAFIAEGWTFDDEKNQKGLSLNLRVEDEPATVRMVLVSPWNKSRGVRDLEELERWARIDVFKIKAQDERLDYPVASSGGGGGSGNVEEPPRGAAATGPSQGALTGVQLRALGASVVPNRVPPGGKIQMVVTYIVEGGGGGSIEVTERRSIIFEGQVLTTLEARSQRTVGTHQSSQPLTLPGVVAPGVYELRAELEAAGIRSTQTSLFQVARAP